MLSSCLRCFFWVFVWQMLYDDILSDPSTDNNNDDHKISDNLPSVCLNLNRIRLCWTSLFFISLRAVHVTDFTSDRYQILTGSDDYTCCLWDIPNSVKLNTYQEHTDYIRCGVTSKLNRDLFVTGEMEAFSAVTEWSERELSMNPFRFNLNQPKCIVVHYIDTLLIQMEIARPKCDLHLVFSFQGHTITH